MKVTLVELTVEDGPLRLSIYAHETASLPLAKLALHGVKEAEG
jgi:hypothetical protein